MTPTHTLSLFRGGLAIGLAGLLWLLLNPVEGAEAAFGLSDGVAHALAFYALTLCLFAAAPKHRRSDLAALMIGLAGATEAGQALVGRDPGLRDLTANVAGIMAAYAPGLIERFRHHLRAHPHRSWTEIRADDGRQSARQRTPGAILRRLGARPWTERAKAERAAEGV